jgi:hypothetical protein
MSGDPTAMKCAEGIPVNGSFDRVQCQFSREPYTTPGGTTSFPASYIIPHLMPTNNSLRVIVDMHGYIATPTSCTDNNGSTPGAIVIKHCAAYYPNHRDFAVGGTLPMDWWGIFKGINGNGYRIAESLARTLEKWGSSVDLGRGFTLRGTSYGGTGAILQSMLLPAGSNLVSVVHSNVPHTLFVRSDPNGADGIDERGHYFRDPAVRLAWGDFDIAKADFAKAAASGSVSRIYYRINGATNDSLGIVDLEFFRLCERYKIACFGTWHRGGHSISEPGVNLPFGQLFDSPQQDVRLDQVLPVFTKSTANNWDTRGHYNLGLAWDSGNIVNTEGSLAVPIRYRRYTNIGSIPDQPLYATFNVTLRNARAVKRWRGLELEWSTGSQSGLTKVSSKGAINVKGITLQSSEAFTVLKIKPRYGVSDGTPLVYTRQPRARTPIAGTPIEEAANWQHASDVGRINNGIAESDVVIDHLNGFVDVIHNCTTSPEICVAQEARVSPDGKKIVYSVGYGSALTEVIHEGVKLGIHEIPALTEAKLWIYDLVTNDRYPIPNHPPGVIDRQPEWLDNDTVVFSSNAGNTFPYRNQFPLHQGPGRCFAAPECVSQEYGYGPAGRSLQIWSMDIDGSDARNLTPHEQMALSPAVLTNGDILYSCWNAHGNHSFDAATSVGPSTSKNKWWLCRMDGNGADSTVILNGHKSPNLKSRAWLTDITGGEGETQLRALRSVAEIFKGKLAVTNYYRGNHVGSMGIVFGMDYGDPHVEGCSTEACYTDGIYRSTRPGSGRYIPSTLRTITPYGTDQDMNVRRHVDGRAAGKAGYPAPLSSTEFLITHARGSCYEVTPNNQANLDWTGGEPTCQKAIYKVKVPMVTNPFDTKQMEMVAGGDQWQAYDARAVTTYQALYGQAAPKRPPALDTRKACFLQVVDARKSELHPARPYNWMTTLYEQCSTQGCAVNTENPDFYAQNVAALTVYLPEMWDISYTGANKAQYRETINNMGHKSIAVLGSQPLEADGSVKMRVPCETPLMMVGTDKKGLVIAHDEMLHSLREGETRTCHGCHDGHSQERAAQLGRPAAERFKSTLAFAKNPPLPEAEAPITFPEIAPILERRCTGCHQDMNNGDGLLYSRLTQDYAQIDWAWMTRKTGPRGDFQMARPYTSKWVAKFARDSLLYWKCVGSRQDGRTDGQYANDIDFGPAHDTEATAAECKLLGRWIDTGIQN